MLKSCRRDIAHIAQIAHITNAVKLDIITAEIIYFYCAVHEFSYTNGTT